MKVLVTGANGHVGCNTVRSLLSKGYEVHPFVRESSDMRGLQNLPGLHFHYGDVTDATSLEKAVQGCDVVIHHAAVYKYFGKSVNEIMEPSIIGTENLFKAAARASIKKIIYTSSNLAIGTSMDPEKILTEQDWNNDTGLLYAQAKTKSEQLAWQLSKQYQISMVTLCPSAILGSYDYRVTPSSRIIVDMMRGIGLTINGNIGIVDVRDVAEMHVAAIEKGADGERFVVSGRGVHLKELGKIYTTLTGRIIPHLSMPRFMDIFSGFLMESIGNIIKWEPPLTSDLAKEFSHRYSNYDNSKILSSLGVNPRPLEETVKDTIRWFLYLNIGSVNKKVRDQFAPDPSWPNIGT